MDNIQAMSYMLADQLLHVICSDVTNNRDENMQYQILEVFSCARFMLTSPKTADVSKLNFTFLYYMCAKYELLKLTLSKGRIGGIFTSQAVNFTGSPLLIVAALCLFAEQLYLDGKFSKSRFICINKIQFKAQFINFYYKNCSEAG